MTLSLDTFKLIYGCLHDVTIASVLNESLEPRDPAPSFLPSLLFSCAASKRMRSCQHEQGHRVVESPRWVGTSHQAPGGRAFRLGLRPPPPARGPIEGADAWP